jgi:microcompartment protein CcmK/EutM
MLLGRVTGTLVASRKDEGLAGQKFLLVQRVDLDGADTTGHVVAVDSVGAGEGDFVLWASGSSARQTELTHERPCDAVVMAIVDSWEVGGEVRYRKTPADGDWAS